MTNGKLSLREALKFARHDFLNELQIVLMHIDLENTTEAKKAIMKTTNGMGQLSKLEKLGLPETETWLLTFDWIFTDFRKTLLCAIKNGIREADDLELVSCLTRIFQRTKEELDPLSEYEVQFEITGTEHEWTLNIIIKGILPANIDMSIEAETFTVEQSVLLNLWTFTISGR